MLIGAWVIDMKHIRKLFSSKICRCILIVLLLSAILIAALAVFLWGKLDLIQYADEVDHQVTESYDDEPQIDIDNMDLSDTVPVIPDAEVNSSVNVQNILLIGTDERTIDFSDAARADSIILVSIDRDHETVKLVSFERAVGVPILEGKYEGQYDLLTHIFRWGGSDLLVKTIEYCFRVEIDNYVRMNFSSVRNIVDSIGGIDISLTGAEAGAINEDLYDEAWVVSAGNNHLNGKEALSFARIRQIDSDWKRVERQRKVILAVVDKLKGSSLSTLNDLSDTVLPMVQTDLTKLEVAELVLYAPHFLKSEFDQMTIPKSGTYNYLETRTGGSALAVDYELNNDLLYRFLFEGATSEALLAE